MSIAQGQHPFPSRTRKLSPVAPMVLPGRLGGRVGPCRIFFEACCNQIDRSRLFIFPICCCLYTGLSCWGKKYDWILLLRWDPHGDSCTMLLEMAFIQAPQIRVFSFCQITAFFLKPPVWLDQHEQSTDGAFSSESQADERAFDIAEHPTDGCANRILIRRKGLC